MGFIDGKQDVANNLALFEVLGNLPKYNMSSSLDSVNSQSKNLLPFIIDLLSITCKQSKQKSETTATDKTVNPKSYSRVRCEANKLLALILTQFFPVLLNILKDGIFNAIKAGLACGADFKLPAQVSVTMDLKNLDFDNLLKVNPKSEVGSLLYGKNPNKDFNYFLYNSIKKGGVNTWNTKNGQPLMDMFFDKKSKRIQFGINPSYTSQGKTFNNFLSDFINSLELFSLEGMFSRLTNELTGVINANLNTSLDKSVSDEKLNKLLDKINDSDYCKEEYQEDNYFVFSNNDLLSLEDIAEQKNKGVVSLDLGCGFVESTITIGDLKSIFDAIRNAKPYEINSVIEQSIDNLNSSLTANVSEQDKKIAAISLNTKIIQQLPKVLTKVVLEPKVVALYQISSKLINGPLTNPLVGQPNLPVDSNIKVSNGFDYAKATKVFFEYVTRESLAALLEITFNVLKPELIRLAQDVAAGIIKKQNSLRVKQLLTVINGFAGGLLNQIPTPNTSKYY